MSFEKFLTNMQSMFTGFADNEEVLTGKQKIHFLFEKVQSLNLNQMKSSLQVSYDLDQMGDVTFDFIANSLAAEAVSLPEYAQTRQASEVDSGVRAGEAPTQENKTPVGTIFTGYYKNFHLISEKDKRAVIE